MTWRGTNLVRHPWFGEAGRPMTDEEARQVEAVTVFAVLPAAQEPMLCSVCNDPLELEDLEDARLTHARCVLAYLDSIEE